MARKDALLRLHQSLVARRADLRRRLGVELQDLAHLKTSSASGDSADAAFDAAGDEITSQLAELEAKELGQVERALAKLKSGTYGTCEGCGQKIPVIRLNALPFSTLCVSCQRENEAGSGWLTDRLLSWDRVSDGDAMDEPRGVDLSDLELDSPR